MRRALLLAALLLVVYALSAPSVVNGDGLGYLRPLRTIGWPPPVPGHLLFVPLLSLLHRFFEPTLDAARAVNALAGALGVFFFQRGAERLLGEGRARDAEWAALGLGVSYAWWVQAADVETYALAAAFLCAAFWALCAWRERPTLARALAAGAATAAASLFHVTTIVFLLAVALWLRRRLLHAAAACALAGAGVAGAYAVIAFGWLHLDLAGAWAWFRGAGHGFTYVVRAYNLTDAIHGLAKSFIFCPYLHETDTSVMLGQYLFGLVAIAVVAGTVAARRRDLPALPWAALAAWAFPYLVIGLLYFGTDSERWIFVMPIVWLLFAAVRPPERLARVLCAGLFLVNLGTGILPAITDTTPRWRAAGVESVVQAGDLVISPGHDWDEYIGFYDARPIGVWPVAYYVGALGKARALELLADEIRRARARGASVFVARVMGDEPEPRGWDELSLMGLQRAELAAWLRARFEVLSLDPVRDVRLYRLDPL